MFARNGIEIEIINVLRICHSFITPTYFHSFGIWILLVWSQLCPADKSRSSEQKDGYRRWPRACSWHMGVTLHSLLLLTNTSLCSSSQELCSMGQRNWVWTAAVLPMIHNTDQHYLLLNKIIIIDFLQKCLDFIYLIKYRFRKVGQ